MATWASILIVIAVVIVVALVALMAIRQRRTTTLRRRFGPEYERTVQERDGRRAGEADLLDRQKQRDRLEIKPLAEPARVRFAAEWREVQERFVDEPSSAVVTADGLVYRVMEARGYPVDDFEGQANLISVDHPALVDNYRAAHDVCERARSQQASTEDLRRALLHYRSLFDDLLEPADADGADPGHGTDDDLSRRGVR
jgi:transposase InsO family protein